MGGAVSIGNKLTNTVDNSIKKQLNVESEQHCANVTCSDIFEAKDIIVSGQGSTFNVTQECDQKVWCKLAYTFDGLNKIMLQNDATQENQLKAPSMFTFATTMGVKTSNKIDNSIVSKQLYDNLQACDTTLASQSFKADDIKIDSGGNFNVSQSGKQIMDCMIQQMTKLEEEIDLKNKSNQGNVIGDMPFGNILIILIVCICGLVGFFFYIKIMSGRQKSKNNDSDSDSDGGGGSRKKKLNLWRRFQEARVRKEMQKQRKQEIIGRKKHQLNVSGRSRVPLSISIPEAILARKEKNKSFDEHVTDEEENNVSVTPKRSRIGSKNDEHNPESTNFNLPSINKLLDDPNDDSENDEIPDWSKIRQQMDYTDDQEDESE